MLVNSICGIYFLLQFMEFMVFSHYEKFHGGVPAKIESYPYVAFIIASGRFCNGGIIGRIWVLTAASCTINKEIIVIAGVDNIDEDYFNKNINHSIQIRKGVNIYIYPMYRRKKIAAYDIALIRVARSFEISTRVKPLHSFNQKWPADEILLCNLVGWSASYDGKTLDPQLQVIQTYAHSGSQACPCLNKFHNFRLACLEPGSGLSQGEAGGSLVCNDKFFAVAHALVDDRCYFLGGSKISEFNSSSRHTFSVFLSICEILPWLQSKITFTGILPLYCYHEKTVFKLKFSILFFFLFLFMIAYVILM